MSTSMIVPGVCSPLQAKLAELVGFSRIWVSGYGVAADLFALPDLDILSYTEKLEQQSRIVKSSRQQSIVDIDAGLQNPWQFRRYIESISAHCPFAICVEDESYPKVSALYSSNQPLVDARLFAERINFIKENTDACIYARTNALTRGLSISETIDRIAVILTDSSPRDLVLHSQSFDSIATIAKEFAGDIKIHVIASLISKRRIEEYRKSRIESVILGHHLLFQTIHHQLHVLKSLFEHDMTPSPNLETKTFLEDLLLGGSA